MAICNFRQKHAQAGPPERVPQCRPDKRVDARPVIDKLHRQGQGAPPTDGAITVTGATPRKHRRPQCHPPPP
jgi:hypothetical protein